MRAQISFEFLTTYGWAILVILVAAAALAYFGVFSPGQYIPDKCEISPELECVDFMVSANQMRFILLNNYEKNIVINGLNASNYVLGDFSCVPALPLTVPVGESREFNCTANTGKFASGEKADIKVAVLFSREGGTRSYTVRGRIFVNAK
jgi:hypothetical protein